MKNAYLFLLSLCVVIGANFFASASVEAQTLPVGCTTTAGYSPTTGFACNGVISGFPAGCTSAAGFSGTTGVPCNGLTAAQNGYDGTLYESNGLIDGCASTFGFSVTTGVPCATGTAPVIPGLPTTGGGGNALLNALLLVASGGAAAAGVHFLVRRRFTAAK